MELEFDICQTKLWNQFFLFSWKSDIDENASLNYHTPHKNDHNLLQNGDSTTAEGVIGPYFFENDDGTPNTINSERCGNMIRFEEYMVSTRRIWPYCKRHFLTRNFSSWWYQLTTKILRFDTIRLFCGAMRKTVFMQINF